MPGVNPGRSLQEMMLAIETYWIERGCVIQQPYPSEVGAGTFNPASFLRALGPEPWRVAYVEPSRRPKDGRYGENPQRFQQFYQYQVLLKPSPPDVVDLYFGSLRAIGIAPAEHDLRMVEDDWESPTLGAAGLGWQIWMDGTEISQFTYFQQCGGIELPVVSAEMTYGLDRIGMMLQGKDRVQDLAWAAETRDAAGHLVMPAVTWGDLWLQNEKEWSRYNFEAADVPGLFEMFKQWEKEAARLLDLYLVAPGYDAVIKCSHVFNLLDARGAISVSERVGYIARVRKLARKAATAYVKQREALGFPLIKDDAERAKWITAAAGDDAKAAPATAGRGRAS
ncbi:MAG: glycine--tRNA ligase subunit alpha [Candidatus Eisenbacteria bacterium]|uniref:Glycine--tRNA ligase alpha subunit n=1 Tax=Eiseniibacteriota bacterium TaxID=2212470 RepID=A0A9D6QNX4_UNCEI|nr:glycine--tRNA ligase subunit alpha [Candidatus Eisenbacteria bacterium]MBI3539364.1 glycine--tRNA ligase subunit alpha [Candidatus Eisenbacteria bacterium]